MKKMILVLSLILLPGTLALASHQGNSKFDPEGHLTDLKKTLRVKRIASARQLNFVSGAAHNHGAATPAVPVGAYSAAALLASAPTPSVEDMFAAFQKEQAELKAAKLASGALVPGPSTPNIPKSHASSVHSSPNRVKQATPKGSPNRIMPPATAVAADVSGNLDLSKLANTNQQTDQQTPPSHSPIQLSAPASPEKPKADQH